MTMDAVPLCRYLRWKSFAREAAGTADLQWSLRRRQVQFSCLRTCEAWGPDDGLVDADACGPPRACFVVLEAGPGGADAGRPREDGT